MKSQSTEYSRTRAAFIGALFRDRQLPPGRVMQYAAKLCEIETQFQSGALAQDEALQKLRECNNQYCWELLERLYIKEFGQPPAADAARPSHYLAPPAVAAGAPLTRKEQRKAIAILAAGIAGIITLFCASLFLVFWLSN